MRQENTSIGPVIQAGVLMLSKSTKPVSYWWILLHTMCYSCSTTACSSWWNHHVDCQQMFENSLCLRRAELPTALLMKLSWELHLVPILNPTVSLEPWASALKPATHASNFFLIRSWSEVPSNPPSRRGQQRLFLLNLRTRRPERLQFGQFSMCRMHEYTPNALKDTLTLRSGCSAHWSLHHRRITPSDVIGRHVGASRSKLTFSLTLVSSKAFKIVTELSKWSFLHSIDGFYTTLSYALIKCYMTQGGQLLLFLVLLLLIMFLLLSLSLCPVDLLNVRSCCCLC